MTTSVVKKNKKDKKDNTKSHSTKMGIVISDKMDKTIVVKVNLLKKHPRYQKRYVSSKKYKVHDQENRYKVGDKVSFRSCRPLSKGKQWVVVS